MSGEYGSNSHARDIKVSRTLSELLDRLSCGISETANLFTRIWYHGERDVITLQDEENLNELTIYPMDCLQISDDARYLNNDKGIVAIGWRYIPFTGEGDLDFVMCVARSGYFDVPFTGVEPDCQPLSNVEAIIINQSMNTYYFPLVKNLIVNRFTKYNNAMFRTLTDEDWVKNDDAAMVAAGILDLSPCVFNGNLSVTNEILRMKKDYHLYNNSEQLNTLFRKVREVNDGLGKDAGYDFLFKKHGIVTTQMVAPNDLTDNHSEWGAYVKSIIIACLKHSCKRAFVRPFNDKTDAFATLRQTDMRIKNLDALYVADHCIYPMFAFNYMSVMYPLGYNLAVELAHCGRAIELLGACDLVAMTNTLERYYGRTLKNRERSRKAASERRKARRNNAVTDMDFDL